MKDSEGWFEDVDVIEKFDMNLFSRIIEKMIVYGGDKIIVGLLDGTGVECEIE